MMAAIPRMRSISENTPYLRVFLEAVQKHFYGAQCTALIFCFTSSLSWAYITFEWFSDSIYRGNEVGKGVEELAINDSL